VDRIHQPRIPITATPRRLEGHAHHVPDLSDPRCRLPSACASGIYLLELLFTATLLALVPYLVLRGTVNRAARYFIGGNKERSGEGNRTIKLNNPDRTSETSTGDVRDSKTGKLDDSYRKGDPEGRVFR
jgi:hypothetical protein